MATTTNYGWTTPDDTALVKDGAAAIRALGTSIDTTTKNLNPSTTLGDIEYRSSTANTNTRLGIGSTGQVLTVAGGVPSWATPAAGGSTFVGAQAWKSSDQTISNATATIITVDSETFDTNGFHDSSTNTGRFTIPSGQGGYYLIYARIAWSTNTTGARILYLYKNGAQDHYMQSGTLSNSFSTQVFTEVMSLSAGDYIEIRGEQSSGGSLDINGGAQRTTIGVAKLGS